MVKDLRSFWWVLTQNSKSLMFYGNGESPLPHHAGNSTGVVKAEAQPDGDTILCTTQSGSQYLVKWSKHVVAIANLCIDRAYLGSLGVRLAGDSDWDKE